MNNAIAALERFLRGDLDSVTLAQTLSAAALQEPHATAALLAAIEAPYRAGRLPQPLYLLLKAAIESPGGAADDADATRITPTMRPSPPSGATDDADVTRITPAMRPPTSTFAPAADRDEEKTQIVDRQTTARTTPPSEMRTAPATGQQSATGASWSSPSQWQSSDGENEEVTLTVGSVIKGRFVLESVVGKGGMGVVYKARDLRKEEAQDRNPHIAVKLLNDDFKRHPESLKALQREARKAQDLAHPNIVNVFDFDRDGGNVYMTMEFLTGALDKLIKRLGQKGLAFKEAMALVEGMASALAYAHGKGVIHSDFKPGNVYLTLENVIKVFDFGIARAAKRPDNLEGEVTRFDPGTLGALTPAYASCEMLEGDEPDARDDIYALACVTYELLAGKHPFNKLSATQARDNKLAPAPIKGLSRRQMRGLLRGLAFSRDQRSVSVDQFLADLSAKQNWLGYAVGGGASLLLVLGLLARAPVENYFQQRNLDQLMGAVRSNKEHDVEMALAQIAQLEREQRDSITRELRDEIIGHYEKKVELALDSSQGHYDYPAAEELLRQARILYPDSAKLEGIITRVDQRKSQQLNELNAKFNDYLEQGRLLSGTGQESVHDLLAIIAQINPAHPLLTDPRLPTAYAAAAEQAMRDQQFGRAGEMLAAGLQLFPKDARLIDLQDRVKVAQQHIARAEEIAALQRQLSTVRLDRLEDLSALRDPMLKLQELDAENPVITSLRSRVQRPLDVELNKKLVAHDWEGSTALLDGHANFLALDVQNSRRAQIAEVRGRYDAEIDALFAAVNKAIQAQRLEPPAKDNALDLLKQAQALVPDDARIVQGKAAIAQTYLQQAREARGRKEWSLARARIQRGLALQPGANAQAALEVEANEISNAEQGLQQQMAQAELDLRNKRLQEQLEALRTQYQAGLTRTAFSTADAAALIKLLDQVAALDPTDLLVKQGREQIAGRLTEEASAQRAAERWDSAEKLLVEAQALIPESARLTDALAELRQSRQNWSAQQQQKQLTTLQTEVQSLLDKPEFTPAWNNRLNDLLGKLATQLPAGSPSLTQSREQAARVYLNKSQEMRQAQRYAEANSLLDLAKRHAELPELAAERQMLVADEAKFNAENQEKSRLAQLQGLQQTLLTQAKANDVKNARATFDKLRSQLPSDDRFIVETAPQALGEAYLQLAERLAARQKFQDAIKLVNSGLEVAPALQKLKDAIVLYTDQAAVQTLRDALSATPFVADALRKGMTDLKANKPDQYTELEKEFAQRLKERVEAQAKSDFVGAEELLHQAQKALPGNALLSALVLTPPAAPQSPAVTETPAPAAAPAPTPATQETKKSETPTAAAPPAAPAAGSSGADKCSASFAGYGARARATCSDDLGASKGPVMVVVPAGAGIVQPFAIGKYEISVGDYSVYCRSSGKCAATGQNESLPMTGITVAQAQEYLKWLTATTGHTYRLPTDQEWTHAATAQGAQGEKDFNCMLRLGDQLVKGLSLLDIKSGKPNAWGLLNYVGNAQEWVTSGGGLSVRGGSYQDALSSCAVTLTKPHAGAADAVTGFRAVREIQPGS